MIRPACGWLFCLVAWPCLAGWVNLPDDAPLRAAVPFPSAEGTADTTAAKQRLTDPISPWTRQQLELVRKYQQNPLRASRALAILHVGAWESWRYAERRGLPPAAAAVAVQAGAGRLLGYLYPQEAAGRFEAAAALAAVQIAATAKLSQAERESAWGAGWLVAQALMQRASLDGADRPWNIRGRPAEQPGIWRKTPPTYAHNPVEPMAGTWQTWVLRSAEEIQPPPPPAFGSDQLTAEAAEVLTVFQQLTPEQKRIAEDWNLEQGSVTPPGVWNRHAMAAADAQRLGAQARLRLMMMLNTAMVDAMIACWYAKFHWWTERPITALQRQLAPDFTPHVVTPPFPSYISGHATLSGAAAEVLAGVFPKQAQQFRDMAAEAAMSRLYGGIHFRSDNEEGLKVGQRIGQLTLQRAEK